MRMGIRIHVWGSGFWIGWRSPLFDDGGGVCLQEEFLEKNPAVISCGQSGKNKQSFQFQDIPSVGKSRII